MTHTLLRASQVVDLIILDWAILDFWAILISFHYVGFLFGASHRSLFFWYYVWFLFLWDNIWCLLLFNNGQLLLLLDGLLILLTLDRLFGWWSSIFIGKFLLFLGVLSLGRSWLLRLNLELIFNHRRRWIHLQLLEMFLPCCLQLGAEIHSVSIYLVNIVRDEIQHLIFNQSVFSFASTSV